MSRRDEPYRDEAALVEAARTDRAAFGELYDRYVDDIYHYVARRVGDRRVAEDITAATWERALGAIERYELRGVPFAAWLYRIAGNLVSNHHRRRSTRDRVPLVGDEGTRAPDRPVAAREAVRAALMRLSAGDREVLALYYFAGLRPDQMSDVLRCSTAAVHKRLQRARERLKTHLEDDPRD